MNPKQITRIVLIIAVCLTSIFAGGFYFSYQKSLVDRDRAIQVERIEQEQKTERTEERSQFWQKVVPWGEDEADPDDV